MLKSFSLFAAVVLIVVASASAPARPPQEAFQASPAKKMAPDATNKAKKLYELDCALCHGSNGDGKTDLGKDMQLTMMDWTDPKSLSVDVGSGALRCDSQRQGQDAAGGRFARQE